MMKTKHEEYTGPSRELITTWIETLEEKDLNKRREARQALTDCGSGCLMMMLDELLEGPFQVRWEIAKALVDMKAPKATGALIKALEDDEQDVRWLAAVALANLGQPALSPLLKALIENDESVYLRQGAHHVLSISEFTRQYENLALVRDALGPMEDVTGVRPAIKAALKDLEN